MEPDFSGYATKYNVKCSDGRTILPGAFKHNDAMRVPLVWKHDTDSPNNILGHVMLSHREDGVYAEGYFNDSQSAGASKELLRHGDINSLSIHARELVQRAGSVLHGAIKEVSLVPAGANPEARIENIYLKHGDSVDMIDDEVIIFSGDYLSHEDDDEKEGSNVSTETESKETESGETVKDVYESLNEKQKKVVHYMIGEALGSNENDSDDSDDDSDDEASHNDSSSYISHQEGYEMPRNVFDRGGRSDDENTLSHEMVEEIFADAHKFGSLKEATLAHAAEYGIDNLEILFPDAKNVTNTPEWIKRRTEWVAGVMSGTTHSPFSRIKSMHADITADEARALGYIKGNLKKEEVFPVLKRVTHPTTVYKKQKLDRDDILDITDFDVVAWIRAEMRVMLDEELARAVLIGDGRDIESPDKIKDPMGANEGSGIRSVLHDNEFYSHKVDVSANLNGEQLIERIIRERKNYKGTSPAFYTTQEVISDLLLARDAEGRRYYKTVEEVASAMNVSRLVEVEVLESEPSVVGIMLNINDYHFGADKGGAITPFDDFDIDYNQHKYLLETRVSGALTKHKSAMVFRRSTGGGQG